MEEKEQFKYLYNQYLNNRCTAEELEQFFTLLDKGNQNQEIMNLMSVTWDQTNALPEEGLVPPFLMPQAKQVKLRPDTNKYFGLQKWILLGENENLSELV